MKWTTRLAAGLLGVGFGWVSYVAVFVEPDMGFRTFGDFLDAEKVAAGYTSGVWLVSDYLYLLFAPAIVVLARASDDLYLRWSGIASALLFLVVGSIDRMGIQLPDLAATSADVVAAVAALLPLRFALLKAGVLCLGVFAWRTTRSAASGGMGDRLWRGLGWVALAAGVGFMFLPLPAPLVFFFWGVALTARGPSPEPA